MWTRHRKPPRLRLLVFPLLALGVATYFVHNATTGRYGLEAKKAYSEEIALLETELAGLVANRKTLEHRTTLLSDGNLEHDMIDEQARRVLGLSRADEIILLQSSN